MRKITLFLCFFSTVLYSQSSIIYESNDLLNPRLLDNRLALGKDSEKKISFFILNIGGGYNLFYHTNPNVTTIKEVENKPGGIFLKDWISKEDSINLIGWMNMGYYIKKFQFNVKAKYFLQDTSHTDFFRFQDTKIFMPEVQAGYMINSDTSLTRLQAGWEPVIYDFNKVDNIFELNLTQRQMARKKHGLRTAIISQEYVRWDQTTKTFYYGTTVCPILVRAPKNPIIRGIDLEFGISRFRSMNVDRFYDFSVGLIGEFLYRHHSSNLYGFIDWTGNYYTKNTLFHAGLFFDIPVFSSIIRY